MRTKHISKHRMLLFICSKRLCTVYQLAFQNIVCYCLSNPCLIERCHVTKFQNIVCYCLSRLDAHSVCILVISKHRMLLFILYKSTAKISKITFQNIVCYCLSYSILLCLYNSFDFKKSYVTVYPIIIYVTVSRCKHFKTSYVTVYLMILSHFPISYFHYFLYFTPFRHFLPASYQI